MARMMRGGSGLVLALVAAALLVAGAAAVHEGAFEAHDWIPTERVGARERVTFMVMLAHRVEHAEMHDTLMSVSDPTSAEYGRHLSVEEIRERFSPAPEKAQAVHTWLGQGLGDRAFVERNMQGDMIVADADAADIERLLQTELYWHSRGSDSDKRYARAVSSIHVPTDLHDTIRFVSVNAAINGNEPLSGRKLRRSMEEPQLDHSAAVSSRAADAAGNTVTVTAGNEMVQTKFNVTCGDGSANLDAQPCSSKPVAQQPVIVATATNVLDTSPPTVIVLDNTQISCWKSDLATGTVDGDTPCDGTATSGLGCVCAANVGPIAMYNTYTLEMEGEFSADDSTVGYGNSTFFTLTDVCTPYFLYDLYNVPYGITVRNNQTNAVVEFLEEYYSPSDLAAFFNLVGMDEWEMGITRGNFPNLENQPGGEGQLDVEYILAVAPNANTSYYSIAGRNPFSSENEPFLTWLYIVGNETNPPTVQSVSYLDVEAAVFNTTKPASLDYGFACSTQFMLMGMRGLSVLFASGDDGVSSFLGRTDPSQCDVSVPNWPPDDPYVTGVGATQMTTEYIPFCEDMYDGTLIDLPVECATKQETVCSSDIGGIITSGGGFSDVFNRNEYAPYQNAAVEAYLARKDILPPDYFFNASGRGYPDISAYGSNYFVYLNGSIMRESGTSASTPVIAAMVTLWNDMRAERGMPPLGFLNPWLYKVFADTPEAFQDVTTGSNNCTAGHGDDILCCEYSFPASAGWDASVGLGTPNFDILANLAVNPNTSYPTVSFLGVNGADGVDGTDGQDATDAINAFVGIAGNDADDDDSDSADDANRALAGSALVIGLIGLVLSGVNILKLRQRDRAGGLDTGALLS